MTEQELREIYVSRGAEGALYALLEYVNKHYPKAADLDLTHGEDSAPAEEGEK